LLNTLVIRRQLDAIFAYRGERIGALLLGSRAQAPPLGPAGATRGLPEPCVER
jgi:hypothetical protein